MDTLVNHRIAVIPARGGSKRIPRKNIHPFLGTPMIAHTIKAAIDSGVFDRVVVSTDDAEIAEVSRAHGADVPFMRDRYGDDHSPISVVTADMLERIAEKENVEYKTVVQLMANCPLRDAEDIVAACTYFDDNPHQFQVSCFKYGWMNPWWAHTMGEYNIPKRIFPQEMRARRSQDQPDLYCPTGAIWIANTAALIKSQTFYGEGHRFFPMKWKHALDIDDFEDLEMGEKLAK